MSINGVAYVTFTVPGTGGDVRAARLERTGTDFTVLDAPLDLDPARDAGRADNRSRVAVAADGSAVATWGEGGRVVARRLFEFRLSAAPSDLTLDAFADAPGGPADAPDVGIEDDSSYAWVVFRQSFGGVARNVARRLVGSQFEAPEAVDGGEPAGAPRLDLGGRGDGFASSASTTSGGAFSSALKDDRFGAGLLLGGGFGVGPFPAPVVAYNGDGAVAYQQGEPGGARSLRLRPYDNDARSRAVALPGEEVVLSDSALGPPDASRGLDAAANRAGDVSVAFVQGEGDGRRIVAAAFDRAPGAFGGYTTSRLAALLAPAAALGDVLRAVGPADLSRRDRRPCGRHHERDERDRAVGDQGRPASLARRRHRPPRPEHLDGDALPARRRDEAARAVLRASAWPRGHRERARERHRSGRRAGRGGRVRARRLGRRLGAHHGPRHAGDRLPPLRAQGAGLDPRQRDRRRGQRRRGHAVRARRVSADRAR